MQYRNEIIIALIGLVGVIFTGVVSNYDKLFVDDISPYENVDDIEMQLRYYVEISGFRNSLEEMDRVIAEKYRLKHQASELEINCVLDNRIQKEQMIELFVDTFKKHVSLQQIKEMNRFYSTETMKVFNKSSPLVVRDLMAGLDKLHERLYVRNQAIVGALKVDDTKSCPTI